MESKLIASGTVKETETLKIVASVYVDTNEAGEESNEVGAHHVTLTYKDMDADALATDAMTYADVAEGAEGSGEATGMVVPGWEGHEDVELSAPASVRYTKTKSFERNNGKFETIVMLRYNF